MLSLLAIGVPTSAHFLYIPGVLLLGIFFGFMLGAKLTRDNIALEDRRRAEREARRKAREERNKAPPPSS
jgi:hypothetical protein